MDAFEQLVAELLFANGWWVETSVKVQLTKEEKKLVGRHSSPRWELDVVGYKASANELLVVECKSFLDSRGVQWRELQDGDPSTRYKLFREPTLRKTVLARLEQQMVAEGRCRANPTIRLGMAAGKIKPGDEQRIALHFQERGWVFFGPDWLLEQLSNLSGGGYSNQVSAVVAKLLLRNGPTSTAKNGIILKAKQVPPGQGITGNMALRLLVEENPKRPGSQAHSRFDGYFRPEATTVDGALSCGVRMDDIRNDLAKGFIELS